MTHTAPFIAIELANERDSLCIEAGEKRVIRTAASVGVADPKRVRLHIPRSIVVRLGLRTEPAIGIKTTWGERESVELAHDCRLTVLGRTDVFRAVVDPTADVCTLGGSMLMMLDLRIDAVTGLPEHRNPNEFIIDI